MFYILFAGTAYTCIYISVKGFIFPLTAIVKGVSGGARPDVESDGGWRRVLRLPVQGQL